MATKQSIIDTITNNYNVTEVETTEGANGYPRNLQTALIVNNWDDAQAIADAYPQVTISSIRKRDGWSLWEERGSMWQPYNMLADYQQYGRVIKTKDDVYNYYLDDINYLRSLDSETLADHLETASKLLRDIDNLADDEYLCTNDGDDYDSWDKVEEFAIGYREDVWQYHIAITFDGISDEEDND
jgi:hypothetical protein